MQYERPVPVPNPGTAPYWKAAREHRLLLPRCLDCGKFHSYPRSRCPYCSSSKLEWTACSGRGFIYTYTEVFRAPSKAFAADLPYVIAIIELEEGPHLMTRLLTTDNKSIRIGQAATATFEDLDNEISLPVFRITPS
jgi:uncharacterized protein